MRRVLVIISVLLAANGAGRWFPRALAQTAARTYPQPTPGQTVFASNGGQPASSPSPSANDPNGQIGYPAVLAQPYLDLDAYLDGNATGHSRSPAFRWQLLPNDIIYKSYLAGSKEPRLASTVFYASHDGWLWGGTLGGRAGLVRYGDQDSRFPSGVQLDVEAAAQVRLDVESDVNVRATDYRAGVPLTFGFGRQQIKLAYYHMSSHLGDEFLLSNPGFNRLNWSRDAIVLGYSIYTTDTLRLYAEAGWAFHSEFSEPWEFQAGAEWAPTSPTGFHGAPFAAVNGHLRQSLNYSGNFVVQVGWAWMSDQHRHLLRLGFYYYNGMSSQRSFFRDFETQTGIGMWYDF